MQLSSFPVLPGSAEAHITCGGTVKCFLIAYFIGNISAKKCQNVFTYVKVIANQMWDVFLRHSVYEHKGPMKLLRNCRLKYAHQQIISLKVSGINIVL